MAYVQQIVTSSEYKALQEVRQALYSQKGCDSLETLVYPKLSVLTREEDDVRPKWDWRVTFILAEKPGPNSNLRPAAIVWVKDNPTVFLNRNNKSIDEYIINLCKRINADYFLFQVKDGAVILIDHLDYYNAYGGTDTSKSLNFGQYVCTLSFCPDVKTQKGEELFVCHESSIDSFLDIQEGPQIITHLNTQVVDNLDKIPINFFSTTSVDALVCLGMPNGIPLFGIEFDGKSHKDTYQKSKDKAKDLIFKYNRLPLLRVKSDVFNTWDKNIDELCFINYQIGRSLTEGLLTDGNFIKLLVHFLITEGMRAGEETNNGSNILTLAKRVEEFFERQNSSIKTLSKKAASWDDQFEGYFNPTEENKLRIINEEKYLGIHVHSVQHKWNSKGLTVTLEFAPNMIERTIMKISSFSFGPYNVVDATGSYDFSEMLYSCMEAVVRRKASESLNEGSPSIRDKLTDLQSLTYIQNMTHNQRVNHYSCNNYMANVINWVSSDSATTGQIQPPPSPICGIKDIVLNNLPDNERDALISDLNKIHDFLVTQNIAKFLFDKKDYQIISTNFETMIVALGGIKKALGDKTLLDFINDIESWRSMINPVRKSWSRTANRM